VTPSAKLSRAAGREVREEGARLLGFVAADSRAHDVVVTPPGPIAASGP
jgi:hypothetical protein